MAWISSKKVDGIAEVNEILKSALQKLNSADLYPPGHKEPRQIHEIRQKIQVAVNLTATAFANEDIYIE